MRQGGAEAAAMTQAKKFAKSVLAAALLGRWEELFVRTLTLAKFVWALAQNALLRRRTALVAWLGSPLVQAGPLPMPWTHLDLPVGPWGRASLLALRRIRRWHAILGTAATGWLAAHCLRRSLSSSRREAARERKDLRRKVKEAESYEQWSEAAGALDELEGKGHDARTRWSKDVPVYDKQLLEARLAHLKKIREEGDVEEMVFALRADMLRNLGHMADAKVYEHRPTIPKPILDYNEEIKLQLQYFTHYEFGDFSPEDKLAYLGEMRHAYGRTALVLSGGGALGTYHVGVVKALYQRGLLPRIISGSSVGSIIGAIVCSRSKKEMDNLMLMGNFSLLDLTFFNNSSIPQILKHFVTKGTFHDISFLSYRLRQLLGDYTFEEAYEKSGRVLNICVTAANTHEPPRLLNYLTAPNVVVWSAVACSSAFPFLFKPTDLLAKNRRGEFVKYVNIDKSQCTQRRWRDGSLEEDLPMQGISEMFNVNYFLVSQVNPHIVPWLALKRILHPKLSYFVISEWKHRCQQLIEILPKWFPKHPFMVFAQRWEGDVTMSMKASVNNYFHLLISSMVNPSTYSFQLGIDQGMRDTWPNLAAIQASCTIEQTLDECINHLKKLHKSSMLKNRGRIPSWLQPNGISRDNSLESLESSEESDRNASLRKSGSSLGQIDAHMSPNYQPFQGGEDRA